MRNFLFSALLLLSGTALFAQDGTGFSQFNSTTGMTGERLYEIIQQEADTTIREENSIRFLFNEVMLICVFQENANRMRIISPIVEREKLGEEELLNALVANYHTALDVKYALSNEIIWSVFIHPLQELQDHQVVDAIRQVYAASVTFGTEYRSTGFTFGSGEANQKDDLPKPKILNKT